MARDNFIMDPVLYTQPYPDVTKESIEKLKAILTSGIDEPEIDKKSDKTPELVDKWIWIEGYKGTNKDMQGHDKYQFEIGKRYDMPTDVNIKECKAGFHLSLNMTDVFKHYKIGKGNRFFKVRALVRERDFNNYGKTKIQTSWFGSNTYDKLASQSIEFIRELTVDEIFQDTEWKDWPEKYKKQALAGDLVDVKNIIRAEELSGLGYSLPFARYIVQSGKYDVAKAVGTQTDLSMDMKALMIMKF